MDTASFGGFLKTLFIIVLIYYAIKIGLRYLFPIFLYKVAKKANENFQQKQQQYNSYDKKESDNTYTSPVNENGKVPRATKVVGEYIDFEEIDKK